MYTVAHGDRSLAHSPPLGAHTKESKGSLGIFANGFD